MAEKFFLLLVSFSLIEFFDPAILQFQKALETFLLHQPSLQDLERIEGVEQNMVDLLHLDMGEPIIVTSEIVPSSLRDMNFDTSVTLFVSQLI